jgi:hypothetical protein
MLFCTSNVPRLCDKYAFDGGGDWRRASHCVHGEITDNTISTVTINLENAEAFGL